jgi:hypothetical protein
VKGFEPERVLPQALMARLTDLRVRDPERSLRAAKARVRRPHLTARGGAPDDGRLNLLAVDHPARGVTRVGDDPLGLADRRDLLARCVRILLGDTVDGVMATMDVLEDLLVLHELSGEAGGPRFLDGKVVLGSMNRGGLSGAAWELDDPVTGPGPAAARTWNLDGMKLLLRVALEERDCLRTLEVCAQAVTELNALGLPTFLEPLVVERHDGQWKVSRSAEKLARLVGVASALGDSSRHLWLKLPMTPSFEQVARATSLPILLLGGESAGDPTPLLREVGGGLAAGHNVRGVLVGRNVLYPGAGDPLAVARAVDGLVHGGWDLARATACAAEPVIDAAGLEAR